MSETLTYQDNITRTGYTEIDGKKVLQHTCTINTGNPKEISLNSVKINQELYKANRAVCRADIAEFEDAAYKLQEQYLAEKPAEEA